jgi:hypothetical protein
MYTLVSALAKGKGASARWLPVDISAIALSDLYMQYASVIAVLSNNFIAGHTSLNLAAIRNDNVGNPATFSQFLTTNANTTLPTTTSVPQVQNKEILYSDAVRARYKIIPLAEDANIDSDLPISQKKWLALTKPGIDYNLFYRSCLVSVNGFIHLSDTDGQKAVVIDGMVSKHLSGQADLGLLSFRELGALTFIPITEAMVHRRDPDTPMSRRLYIDTGVSGVGKTPMLVLGGYLHVLDNRSFCAVGDSLYYVDVQSLPLVERYYESRGFLDMTSLNLDVAANSHDRISLAQFYSDAVLTKYTTLSQSFIVLVDNDSLYTQRIPLRRTHMAGMFTSHIVPNYPLITGYGKVSNYWRTYEDQQWSITTVDGQKDNFKFRTTEFETPSVDNKREGLEPSVNGFADFLKIGSETLVYVSGAP